MAEGESTVVNVTLEPELKDKADSLECAVCLQTCIHPAQLPCGHIFCFLCIKGIANQSKKCAMCRQEIPRDFIEHPNLLHADIVSEITTNYDGTYQWFYEGRNGWWQYDERTSRELEASYKAGEKVCELLIAGFLYIADLEAMLQIRRHDPTRRRRIKRDLANIPKKGIAGLRTESDVQIHDQDTQLSESGNSTSNSGPVEGNNGDYILAMPSNSPQTHEDEREFSHHSDLQETIERIGNLRLDDDLSTANVRRPQRRVRTFDV